MKTEQQNKTRLAKIGIFRGLDAHIVSFIFHSLSPASSDEVIGRHDRGEALATLVAG